LFIIINGRKYTLVQGTRRIPVLYKTCGGNKQYGGVRPDSIKVNAAGVMPIILLRH
jgi:preprotein translocase subunit SecY